MDNAAPGFQFPGWFEVKAFGAADAGLETLVPSIVIESGLALAESPTTSRPSSGGRFVAVSVTFQCPSREALIAVHEALRAHPDIKWTL